MIPEIKITMIYSTFTQYQPHDYMVNMQFDISNNETLSRCEKEIFIENAIKKLQNELIKHRVETILQEQQSCIKMPNRSKK
jgi:hypothetical protein